MQSDYVIRVQSDYANRYSLGEVVVPGVAFFPGKGRVNWTKAELEREIIKVKANGGRIVQ